MPITLDGTNGVTFPDGSNTVPVVKGTTAGNTSGIVFPAANTVAFVTSGVERARIDSAGNMGVGTSSPSYKLHLYGNSGITRVGIQSAASVASSINFMTTNDSNGYVNYDTGIFKFFQNFNSAASPSVTFDVAGRVLKPYQPYLRAVTSASAQSLTGGQTYVIPYNVISAQNGSNYNNSTYRFTCPVAGQYFVHAAVEGSSITTNYYNLFLRINGNAFAGTYVTGRNTAYEQLSTTGIVAASASDYIDVALFVNQTGGTLELNPGDIRNSLHIYLLG